MTSYVDLIFYAFFKLFLMFAYRHMHRHVEMCIQFFFKIFFFTFYWNQTKNNAHCNKFHPKRAATSGRSSTKHVFFFYYQKEMACSCNAKKPLYYLTLLATVPYHNLGSFGVSESLACIRSTAAAFLPSSLSDHKNC